MAVLTMDIRGGYCLEELAEDETTNAVGYRVFFKELIDRWHRDRKHAVRLCDDDTSPHRNTSIASWIEQRNIQCGLQLAYHPNLSPCDYEAFHTLKGAIDE